MADVAYGRGKRQAWKKVRDGGGTCFSVSFDQLETALRLVGSLTSEEKVERFSVDNYGVTVFTEGGSLRSVDKVKNLRK